jgi:NAD(P)-dependent dehydrogenase (short-subunit alcohol dehydrogenase family)
VSVRGKIVVVTGATAGIGRATAAELAGRGARVFVHGRSWERARGAVDELRRETGTAALEPVAGDLGHLNAVRALAAELNARLPRLDVLINNAGVFMRERVLTDDGLETTFAVNHLAPFWLTLLLLDRLRASAPARIVNVSSTTHHSAQVEFGNLQGERHYDGYSAYALSKLGNVLFTNALARRLAWEGAGVTANALHPGVVRTNLLRAGWGGGGTNPEAGARTPVYLAADPAVASTTGLYFVDQRPTPASALARDEALQEQFWEVSEQLIKAAGADQDAHRHY